MAEFYSARGWEIPPLPWTNLSPPFSEIVITEKSSQAKDVRAAVGGRYGAVLPAEGHLLDLCEPEDVNPAWKRWSAVLLRALSS